MALLLETMALDLTRPKVDVQLFTVEKVEAILREARVPVSRQWLLDRLRDEGVGTTRQRLNRALEFFFRHSMAVEGSKGVQWTKSESPSLALARLVGRRM